MTNASEVRGTSSWQKETDFRILRRRASSLWMPAPLKTRPVSWGMRTRLPQHRASASVGGMAPPESHPSKTLLLLHDRVGLASWVQRDMAGACNNSRKHWQCRTHVKALVDAVTTPGAFFPRLVAVPLCRQTSERTEISVSLPNPGSKIAVSN